jgi:hypothetical protein
MLSTEKGMPGGIHISGIPGPSPYISFCRRSRDNCGLLRSLEMSLIIFLFREGGGGVSVMQAAPCSGLRRGKRGGIVSSDEIVEASMSLSISLSGMFRLGGLTISSSPRKDCCNEEVTTKKVPSILPPDGSKHVEGKTAPGPLDFENWGADMVTAPLVVLLQVECDDKHMLYVSNLKIVSQEKI